MKPGTQIHVAGGKHAGRIGTVVTGPDPDGWVAVRLASAVGGWPFTQATEIHERHLEVTPKTTSDPTEGMEQAPW